MTLSEGPGVTAGLTLTAMVWEDDSDGVVRTSHIVSGDGSVFSSVFESDLSGSEAVFTGGSLNTEVTSLTETEIAALEFSDADSDIIDCIATATGLSSLTVAFAGAACGLVCASTLGAGCVPGWAAALGIAGGAQVGVTAGCLAAG